MELENQDLKERNGDPDYLPVTGLSGTVKHPETGAFLFVGLVKT